MEGLKGPEKTNSVEELLENEISEILKKRSDIRLKLKDLEILTEPKPSYRSQEDIDEARRLRDQEKELYAEEMTAEKKLAVMFFSNSEQLQESAIERREIVSKIKSLKQQLDLLELKKQKIDNIVLFTSSPSTFGIKLK
ncbi:MAG: hypothetical protein Q7S19_03555 [bacterium]|nr:hypothetical protein [bacterium]